MRHHLIGAVAVFFFISVSSQAAWLVKRIENGKEVRVISIQHVNRVTSRPTVDLRSIPVQLSETRGASKERFVETLYAEDALPKQFRRRTRVSFMATQKMEWAGSEVRTLVNQGPKENRINLTMVGDGYTEAEKEKFFEDAQRTTHNLFTGDTFASYLPLFNVYAVFVPSNESGLTDGENKKDTALGLYRDPPHSKRAIIPGNTTAIDQAIALAPATDYPILIANDDFYGGLGGQYAVTTRSVESGIVVLRHELGHNFGQVGEEYDGGSVYAGANFSDTTDVPWKHWIEGDAHVYESQFLSGSYLWQDFSAGPIDVSFDFPQAATDGAYLFDIIISSVGWKTPDDVYTYLDGEKVEMDGIWTADRSFFTLKMDRSIAPGHHTLEFKENTKDANHMLAFAEVYAHPPGMDFTPGKVEVFSDFNDSMTHVGYRPTFFSCIMRNMKSSKFCPVDEENMWNRFLDRVDLIDGVDVSQATGNVTATLKTPTLSGLTVKWYKIGADGGEIEMPEHANQMSWNQAKTSSSAQYRVKVHYETTEVRKPTSRYDSQKDFQM